MKTTRRTKIRFEKREVKFVRFSGTTKLFCGICQTETVHLPVAQTANALALSELNIFRLAERGQIHSTETAHGQFLICAASVADFEK